MAIQFKLQQSQKLSQQMVITPQLQQAIKLLQKNHQEMAQELQKELLDNPMLEESQEQDDFDLNDVSMEDFVSGTSENNPNNKEADAQAPNVEERQLAEDLNRNAGETPEPTASEVERDLDWSDYQESYSYSLPSSAGGGDDSEYPSLEATVSAQESLLDHLKSQLGMNDLDDRMRTIATLMIEEINDDGYLPSDIIEWMQDAFSDSNLETDELQNALNLIRSFDPPGVGSFSLQDCLLFQLEAMSNPDPLAIKLVSNFISELEKRKYKVIAKELNIDLDDIASALKVISTLEPKPGRSFATKPTNYVSPDIYVSKVNGEWVITPNDEGIPKLRISSLYREALAGSKGESKSYIQEKLRNAAWLLRSVQMRQRTLYKVTESILKFHEDFFEYGPGHLKPLILKDVAEDIEMHESTISRVTTNKYVHTPRGLFELKYFFNSSISTKDGDAIASEAVRDRIRDHIAAEDQAKPLSDQKLVKLLAAEGIKVARRTVAKYREMLKIPSSSARKNVL